MLHHWIHSNHRLAAVAAMLCLPVVASGCALRDAEHWKFDRFRDDRAVEIEQRLNRDEPIVKSPF